MGASSEVPLFFSRKVVKPVKGGGKGIVNPYGSAQKQPLNFQDFVQKQSAIVGPKQHNKANIGTQPPIMLGNMNAPIIKPEY